MGRGSNISPRRWVTDYWHGKAHFLVTMAVGLLGLRVALAFIQGKIPSTAPVLLLVLWLLANGIIGVWQLVGAVRKTHSVQTNSSDTMLVWCGWATIFAAASVTLFQAVDLLTITAPTREEILMANYEKPSLQISNDGTTAYIQGNLDYESNTGLLNAIADHPGLHTVSLESDGGLVFAARALARNILQHKLNTRVEKICSSSCTLVFAAGQKRSLGPTGKIGFHQYALLTKFHTNTLDIEEELRRDRRFFIDRGFTAPFVTRIFSAPPDQMWYPTRQELLSGNVVTP